MAMNIQRLNFDPVTGDNPSEAFMKLDLDIGEIAGAIDGDGAPGTGIDSRLSAVETAVEGLGDAATKNVGTAAGTVAAGNDSRLRDVGTTAGTVAAGDDARITGAASKAYVDANKLPVANPTFTGMITKTGSVNVFCYRVSNANNDQGIGGSFADWAGNLTPALQVDSQLPGAAYMGVRWTHWGVRHLAAISAYEGGTTSSAPTIGFHFENRINSHVFDSNGNAVFAGILTQNSDYRIKDDVVTIDPSAAADGLRLCRPVEYTDNRNSDGTRLAGFIAHEEQAAFPLLVTGQKDAMEESVEWQGDTTPYPPGEEPEGWVPPVAVAIETPKLQSLSYDRKVVYLTAGWQHHDRRIAELETTVQSLLDRVTALEAR